MKQSSVNNNKKLRSVPTPTQQDYDQDRFYYNNDEDTREIMQEFGYSIGSDEEQRVSKYW